MKTAEEITDFIKNIIREHSYDIFSITFNRPKNYTVNRPKNYYETELCKKILNFINGDSNEN